MQEMAGGGAASAGWSADGSTIRWSDRSFFGAADQISRAVSAGNLAVSPAGGQALISALEEIQHWYASHANDLYKIAQAPRLGDTVAAGVVSPHMQQTGIDSRGYVTQLHAFVQAIEKYKESIRQAMKAYHHTEQDNHHRFHQAGVDLAD
ncbi:MAG: hypothetical protein ACRDQ5_21775 [Sciscionella sp.]